MDDQGTDSIDGIQVDDGPSTSSGTVCADGEGSTEEVCVIPESVSEVEVDTGASEEDSDLMKPPVLEPEEPLPNEASPHADNPENTIIISSEDLVEAGLDMDNLNDLTNEQVAVLMEIAERRVQREMEAAQTSVESQQTMEEVAEEHYEGDDVNVQVNNEALTMVITDDGSLKLTDACNQTFFFSSEQLNTMNIDVNNLTDESIQQIVQVAMPVIQVGKPREASAEDQVLYDHDVNVMQPSGSGMKSGFIRASQLIGEQIDVRRNGKTASATIRYVRNGGAFKVQFDDGHFEWVTEDQIIMRGNRTHTDHEGYHNGSSPAVPRVVHASSMAGLKRAAAAGGGCREAKRANLEPNFCCPICENKVYQKEPAYIVIRIPACDSCTREKIIVLDDGTDGDDDRAVL